MEEATSTNSTLGPLYGSGRIFTGVLNYTFRQLPTGNYFLRLHFCPFALEDSHNVNESTFGVLANGLRLLSGFNVAGEASISSSYLIIREYLIPINSNGLVLEFAPEKGSPFGFVNAIEMVSVVGQLFSDSIGTVGGGSGGTTSLNLNRGLETVYRLNVGGPEIQPRGESGLWRHWGVDTGYMINPDAGIEIKNTSNITYASMNDSAVAPLVLYETARTMSNTQVVERKFNMSWKFKVDPGFDYLVRLHFCELVFDQLNGRNFRIFINNKSAADNFDIYAQAGGKNRGYHHDYVDAISSKVSSLWIQLGPDTATGASGTDALLNGLEIYKLGRNGNLAYTVKTGTLSKASSSNARRAHVLLWGVGMGLASVALLAVVIGFNIVIRRKVKMNESRDKKCVWKPLFLNEAVLNSRGGRRREGAVGGGKNANGSLIGSSIRVGRRFAIAEIRAATRSFDESMVIGVGGFGKVFRGEIDDGTLVAIKRANPQSEQGLNEFETEIEVLSKLRHRHLVSMIGFCEENNEMILVYEFMANGTLRSHLFGSDLLRLSWKQRLEVCIGAARGLHYLHTGADRSIIHRDVKTTNILLDENFVSKMSDFGLSRTGPALDRTHVSTAVKGSFGYLDPEYFRRQQLTEKSDVYSFGVVLFEVVCARAVINPSLPKDQINLAEWALRWQRERSLEKIVDPFLEGGFSPESMEKYGEIAEKCLADEGRNRPTMGEVLWHLEYVLHLHEMWLRANNIKDDTGNSISTLESQQAMGT
ncbi:hypothetical protein SAY87_000770 [Trapa incisa]|uniref:Protein kinase domain-containing protein n=1 Tax=Trapa incisa TaxID=236973 RepID=A0AAN7GS45_9MYRT|nr:hypothetical protein SAY87_000770 [Trapa incisa]